MAASEPDMVRVLSPLGSETQVPVSIVEALVSSGYVVMDEAEVRPELTKRTRKRN